MEHHGFAVANRLCGIASADEFGKQRLGAAFGEGINQAGFRGNTVGGGAKKLRPIRRHSREAQSYKEKAEFFHH